MKFKLIEAFDFTSSAISEADKLASELKDFIIDIPNIKHGNEYLSSDDIKDLEKAVSVLEAFYKNYRKFARENANAFYSKKED